MLLIAGCKPTRKLTEGQYLLIRNQVELKNETIEKSEISSFIKQHPNRKQLGLYLRVRLYRLFAKGKENKFKSWVKKTLGEEPVLLDTSLTDQSVKQIRMYLNTKGYFKSEVNRDIRLNPKNKTAVVTYRIRESAPYFVRKIDYRIQDETLRSFVMSGQGKSLIRSGDQYNEDNLSLERDRISLDLNNAGYYYFSPDFIRYRIDTALNNHQLDITIEITDPVQTGENGTDTLMVLSHKRYLIRNIYIHTDYDALRSDTVHTDTTRIVIPNRRKDRPPKTYYFISHGPLKIKPKTLTQQIFVDSGDFYNFNDLDRSHKQLLDLRIYRYANLLMDDVSLTSDTGLLNLNIYLSRLPIQALSLESQVTNKGGYLGTALGVVYENRNLVKGAEILSFKMNGAVEIDFKTTAEERAARKIPFFNTIEAGTELTMKIPKFLLPVRQEKFSKTFRPKTNASIGFNYQQRSLYTRYTSRASFGYEWRESAAKTHLLIPIDFNSVVIYPDSTFKALIESFPDKITQNTYKDHIITAIKYSFIYNTQQIGKKEDFMYFRGNLELAGIVFWAYNRIVGKEGSFLLFGVPYSQFLRLDADYRYYKYFRGENSLATRVSAGFGMPLTKNNALPFEKYFYLGGANSMRGWRLRTLGPGSYVEPDSLKADNIGEIVLELNAEYRFPVYKYFKGAAFVDAGNIWLRQKNDLYPGAEFRLDRFYKEIAIAGGLGLRIDFDYFLVRMDWGVPIKNPGRPEGDRWIFQAGNPLKVYWNLGIGYPF